MRDHCGRILYPGELRSVLQNGGGDTGDREHHDDRQQKYADRARDAPQQHRGIGARLKPKASGVVEKKTHLVCKGDDPATREEAENDQNSERRREDRGLAGGRDVSFFDRVRDLLFARLFCFTVFVLAAGHSLVPGQRK